jgi:hypothetical protein
VAIHTEVGDEALAAVLVRKSREARRMDAVTTGTRYGPARKRLAALSLL